MSSTVLTILYIGGTSLHYTNSQSHTGMNHYSRNALHLSPQGEHRFFLKAPKRCFQNKDILTLPGRTRHPLLCTQPLPIHNGGIGTNTLITIIGHLPVPSSTCLLAPHWSSSLIIFSFLSPQHSPQPLVGTQSKCLKCMFSQRESGSSSCSTFSYSNFHCKCDFSSPVSRQDRSQGNHMVHPLAPSLRAHQVQKSLLQCSQNKTMRSR